MPEQVCRMIRVDHAGEFGATRIYAGQLAVLPRAGAIAGTVRHMAAQEQRHREVFDRMLPERRVRPTLLAPFWHVAGFALGAATALLGEKAAMACTVAVEEVIDEHYRAQAEILPESEESLRRTFEEFRAEELEHRDIGIDHGAERAPAYTLLSSAIKSATKLAIWLSTRI
jgi:ubiquinone biosynthesis monooxygenase Coq7